MSRQIDVSNPENLSEEDRRYLQDRGLIDTRQYLDYAARIQAAADAVAQKSNRGTLAQRMAAQEESRKALNVPEVPLLEEVDEPYDKWKVDDLRDECRARGLSDEGKKEELVARLMADDEQS
ncbi:MAG: SAP domain-containing protein [Nitrospira sp.]